MKQMCIALATLAVALTGLAGTGRVDLIIMAPSLEAAPGTTGSFDVVITNTNPSGGDSYFVSLDTLALALSGPAGVSFTDVSIATIVPYLFADPGVNNGGGPFSFDAFPNTSFLASDSEFGGMGFDEIAPGATFGLAHVSFAVDASAAAGDRGLDLGAGTSLFDVNGDPVAFRSVNGVLSGRGRSPSPRRAPC